MADPLDLDLRERLAQIAAAVPVADPGQLEPVSARVRSSTSVDRLAVSGLLPVLVLLVLGTLIAGLAQVGPFTGRPSPDATGPVVDVDSSGPYALELRSGRRAYLENQPIEIDATFRYASDRSAATILSRSSRVIGFGIEEPVHGMQVATLWTKLLSCGLPISRVLQPGTEILEPFEKDGTPQAGEPDAEAQQAFLDDPVLRLPPGVWHVYAVTSFSEIDNGCDTRMTELRPVIEIEVLPAPAASTADGPVVASTTDQGFALVIRSAKARYTPDESIDISAELTFGGSGAVEIGHALGARGSPLGFGIEEPVLGDLLLSPGWDLACARTELKSDVPITQPFQKSSGWSSNDPRSEEYRRFTIDPDLRLPVGSWHIFAVAEFSVGDCSAQPIRMRVDIAIEVAAFPTTESPPPSAEPADGPVISRVTDGLYDLELRSARSTYYESEAIDVSGASTYTGDRSIEVSGLRSLALGVDEPVYGITLEPIFTMACTSGVLNPGDRFEHPFVKSGVVLGPDPATDFQRSYLDDPVFRLPPGTWHIRASASFLEGSGCLPEAPKHSLSTALEIVVLPDPANQIELKTAPLPTTSDGTTVCMMARGEGMLARNEHTGLGFGGKPVTWPEGYTARIEGGRAVLIAPSGAVVAREGDRIVSGGGFGADKTWIACGFGIIDGAGE